MLWDWYEWDMFNRMYFIYCYLMMNPYCNTRAMNRRQYITHYTQITHSSFCFYELGCRFWKKCQHINWISTSTFYWNQSSCCLVLVLFFSFRWDFILVPIRDEKSIKSLSCIDICLGVDFIIQCGRNVCHFIMRRQTLLSARQKRND